MDLLKYTFLTLYGLASLGLFVYGVNCYVMLGLFFRKRKGQAAADQAFLKAYAQSGRTDADLPRITTQLPIFNERYVVRRLIDAVVAMDYPQGRHEIQVLDDSTDDTRVLVAEIVDDYRRRGVDIVHLTRENREGFKAGALNVGTATAKGEFLTVFDADFIPPRDFLRRTVPFFEQHEKIAMVQTRWGHVNRDYSLLTQAQAVGIDGHFVIEQGARTWNDLYMNFNGTAGLWRKTAVLDAGGWEADTLTEDLDLSYRVQLAGWRMKYLVDVVTPSELPVDINGLKSQQHRWAKGSIQTAMKILPLVFRQPVPLFKKLEAVFHLTHYLIHPLMLTAALCALPALRLSDYSFSRPLLIVTGAFLFLSTFSPSILYFCSQRVAYADWKRRILILPVLVAIGVGIAVNNTKAVLEAVSGRKSGFVRTPKYGVETGRGADARKGGATVGTRRRVYRIPPRISHFIEIVLGLYGFYTLYQYGEVGKWAVMPFLLLNATGFLTVGSLSLIHWWRSLPRPGRTELATAR